MKTTTQKPKLSQAEFKAKQEKFNEFKTKLIEQWDDHDLDGEAVWRAKIEGSQFLNVTELASDINRQGTVYNIKNFKQFYAAYGFKCPLGWWQMQSALKMAAVSGCLESDELLTEDGAIPTQGNNWRLVS